jgi:hypothetical protein
VHPEGLCQKASSVPRPACSVAVLRYCGQTGSPLSRCVSPMGAARRGGVGRLNLHVAVAMVGTSSLDRRYGIDAIALSFPSPPSNALIVLQRSSAPGRALLGGTSAASRRSNFMPTTPEDCRKQAKLCIELARTSPAALARQLEQLAETWTKLGSDFERARALREDRSETLKKTA